MHLYPDVRPSESKKTFYLVIVVADLNFLPLRACWCLPMFLSMCLTKGNTEHPEALAVNGHSVLIRFVSQNKVTVYSKGFISLL